MKQNKSAYSNNAQKGYALKFPEKLMNVLNDAKYNDCIRWSVDGLSFEIIDPVLMEKKLLEEVFNGEKLHSFVRKVYKWGFVSRPSGQMVWKAFSYHMFQRGNHQLCRQMKRDKRNLHPPSYHPRLTLQSQEKYRFCGASGTSSSISSSSNSTAANRTITSVSGIGNNSCCNSSSSSSCSSSSIDMKSAHFYASEFRATLENTPHFDVLVRSLNDNSANSFDINDLNELLCILEDLE